MEICTAGLLAFILCLTFIYLYTKNAHGFFRRLGISGPVPKALFGIFPEYKAKGFAQTDLDLTKQYGKVVGIYHGHKPVLLVADPDIVKAVCVTQFSKFPNRKIGLDLGPLLRRTVALSKNNQWKFLREHISEIFQPIYLIKITGKLVQSAEHLVSNVQTILLNEKDFNFQDLCLSYSVDSLCNSLFSHNVDSFNNKKDTTVTMIRKGWIAGNVGVVKPALACAVCPAMSRYFAFRKYDAIPSDVIEFLKSLVINKMTERHDSEGYSDFLAFLMNKCRRNSIVTDSQNNTTKQTGNLSYDYRLSEEEIVANSLFFFLAGYDTTASAVIFTLYCLAKNVECQEKLIQEIQSCVDKTGLSYDVVDAMSYLEMVLCETLRLFPTYLRFSREVERDTNIKGTIFTKGIEVAFSVYALHMNEEYFPDPGRFDPERFNEENTSKRNPFCYVPFGVGSRDCFGQAYAKLAIKVAVISLLTKFKFSLSKVQKDPPELSKEMYIRPAKGLWLSVEPR